MRRFLPAFLLALASFVPFAVGCDLSKKNDGVDAALPVVVATAPSAAPTAAPTETAATTAVPPLGAATTAPPTGVVHAGDAGKPVAKDAGAKDAAAPAPTAPGFPTALPPFPTALPGIDAGMFKLPDGGFKPPWVQ